jgi:hypothetical protein
MNFGSAVVVMVHEEVPNTYAMWVKGLPSIPTVPMPPACASIMPADTAVPGARPSSAAAAAVRPDPSATPGSTTRSPMRANPAFARSPRPMLSK